MLLFRMSCVGFSMILMEKNPSRFFPFLCFYSFIFPSYVPFSFSLFRQLTILNGCLIFFLYSFLCFLLFYPLSSFLFLYVLTFSALLFLIKTYVFLIKLSFSIKRHHFVNNIFLLLNGCSKSDYL